MQRKTEKKTSKGMSPSKNGPSKYPTVGERLVAGLKELHDALKSGEPLERRFTVRTVERIAEPHPYSPLKIRATRELVGASQAVFAKLLGVSKIQAQSWERGVRTPSKLACRLLDEINRDPEHWRGMIGTRAA
jgi:DNA-binding transcriptional regulator YiaG